MVPVPGRPAHDRIHTAICATAANFPLTKLIYPSISTFTPCFITTFHYLNLMDYLMTSTKRWTDNCMGWVPPCSQIYLNLMDYLMISRMNSVCAAAIRPNTNDNSFSTDVDGPRFMANLFGQACNHDANEQANLTSPGASTTYAGSLKLWQDAHYQSQFLSIPPTLDVNADDVTDTWSSFLRLSDHDSTWFQSIAAMMAKYCQFWKGSAPLYDCSASSSAAGAVRCTATQTNVFTPPQWTAQTGTHNNFQQGNQNQVGHYNHNNSPSLSLTFKAATSLEDISETDIFAALTYNIYLSPNDAGHVALRQGQFWTIQPDAYTKSGIEIYPSVFSLLARDYHSDT